MPIAIKPALAGRLETLEVRGPSLASAVPLVSSHANKCAHDATAQDINGRLGYGSASGRQRAIGANSVAIAPGLAFEAWSTTRAYLAAVSSSDAVRRA